ncbi:MAG TPA: ATP-binding protein, partial [Anaeromyxobacter sp.]|nr:ATP-binding protein [Anaeromyxobacter sp.]
KRDRGAREGRDEHAKLVRAPTDAERAARRLALLQDVTGALSAARDLGDVAGVVADRVRDVLGAAAVTLRRIVDGRLVIIGVGGDPAMVLTGDPELPLDADAPAAAAARRNEPLWEDALADAGDRPAGVTGKTRAYAVVPLAPRGKVLGTITLAYGEPRALDDGDRAFILALARECAEALDRATLFEAEVRSRAQLDAFFENAPLGVGLLDRDFRFVRVNAALAETNGIPQEAHVGRTPRDLLPGLPMDEMERSWREVLRTGTPVLDFEVSGETPAAPGKRRTWLESWYPIRIGDEIAGLGVLAREVTAEREAEEFRQNVLGIVGHDLRNPLSALFTSAQLLMRAEDVPPERSRMATRIFANAERMRRIIDVLADYARVRGGQRVPLRLQRCDIADIASAVADECEATHPGREVRRDGEGDSTGEWDPDRLGQVLANLVSNALDYSRAGTPVVVSWRGEPGAVVVEVANEGNPVPRDVLPRIFDPFRRGDAARSGKREGLGLGLFIAKALVSAHGGAIDVQSEGGVTVFTVRLPRHPPGAAGPGAGHSDGSGV